MTIAQRLLAAKNDARMAGKLPVVARISPQMGRELDLWIRQQNRVSDTGIPRAKPLTRDDIWGLKVIDDPKVKDVIHFEMK